MSLLPFRSPQRTSKWRPQLVWRPSKSPQGLPEPTAFTEAWPFDPPKAEKQAQNSNLTRTDSTHTPRLSVVFHAECCPPHWETCSSPNANNASGVPITCGAHQRPYLNRIRARWHGGQASRKIWNKKKKLVTIRVFRKLSPRQAIISNLFLQFIFSFSLLVSNKAKQEHWKQHWQHWCWKAEQDQTLKSLWTATA